MSPSYYKQTNKQIVKHNCNSIRFLRNELHLGFPPIICQGHEENPSLVIVEFLLYLEGHIV